MDALSTPTSARNSASDSASDSSAGELQLVTRPGMAKPFARCAQRRKKVVHKKDGTSAILEFENVRILVLIRVRTMRPRKDEMGVFSSEG